MFRSKEVKILVHERGLLYKDKEFNQVLNPGTYKFYDPFGKVDVVKYDMTYPEFGEVNADILLKSYPDKLNPHIEVINITENQLGLLYLDGKLIEIIEPSSKRFFWKGPLDLKVTVIDITDDYLISSHLVSYLYEAKKKRSVSGLDAASIFVQVKDQHEAVLTVDGAIVDVLKTGVYGYWKFNRDIVAYVIDTRLQNLELLAQEILTKDKVSIRINLSSNFKIVDVRKVFESLPSHKDYMHKELQFVLREAVGKRSLDEMLTDKHDMVLQMRDQLVQKLSDFGLNIIDVDIKDIILPGDMRELMNQVVEAEKAAQANIIRRREETAATRSLHNTAKMLDNNPTLMRLKELEVLEKITENVDKISVHNGLNGIMNDFIHLRESK